MTNIVCRNSVFHFRYRIPFAYQSLFGSKEVHRTLSTRDMYVAQLMSHALVLGLNGLFQDIRNGIVVNRQEVKARLTEIYTAMMNDQRRFIDRFGPKSMSRLRLLENASTSLGSLSELIREGSVEKFNAELNSDENADYISNRVNRAYKKLGEDMDLNSMSGQAVAAEVTRVLSDWYLSVSKLHEGSKAYSFDELESSQETEVALPPSTTNAGTELLSSVWKEYVSEKESGDWSEKGKQSHDAAKDKLIEICGDLIVGKYTKKHAREFKQTLLKLPPRVSLIRETKYNGMTLTEIAQSNQSKTLNPKTINQTIGSVSGFMQWCENNGYATANVFKGVSVPVPRGDAREKRYPFSIDEVIQIVEAAKSERDIWKKWLVLLGVYTGARINEICQLYKSDIRTSENGISYISINDDTPDKSLKTSTSKRLIPIHRFLLDAGFTDFVSNGSHERLFPNLKYSNTQHYSHKVTRWFNRTFKQKLALSDSKKKSFHSLRHAMADELRSVVDNSYLHRDILGHAQQGVTDQVYGSQSSLADMKSVIDQTYPNS